MNIFETLFLRLAHLMPPEAAHNFTIRMLQLGITPTYPSTSCGPDLSSNIFGLRFENPVGLAAGFDKSCQVFEPVSRLGPGFIEVGTLTLRAQKGNKRPRGFRLEDENAVINRYGFNNDGLSKGLKRLGARNRKSGIIGINVGINKDTTNAFEDYAESVDKAMKIADYITINVSSPNTPGLRDLQEPDQLNRLLGILVGITKNNSSNSHPTPLLVKIAPDLDITMIKEIVDVARNRHIAGLIVSNTTVSRPSSLKSDKMSEAGGLSGPPLFELSTIKLAQTFLAAKKQIPIIYSLRFE